MERKHKFPNYKYKPCEQNYLKIFSLKYLIILLCLISIKSFINHRNQIIFISENNQISLKVKGNGNIKIFNPLSQIKPSSYYLNRDPVPKQINNDATIELHNSDNFIKLIFSNAVTSCNSLFKGCSNIIEIDLINFDSSNVQNINSMFQGCTSLKKIKFGNFQTSRITSISNSFYGCSSLETLDLSSFDTSNVNHYHFIFQGCSSLVYVDLSNFDTTRNPCGANLFYNGCAKLEFVNFKQVKLSTAHAKQYENSFHINWQ